MENLVLVGVDGSKESAGAAEWALAEAKARHWGISFTTVVPPAPVADPQVDAGYRRGAVHEAELVHGPMVAHAQARGLEAQSHVIPGRASDVLIRLSAQARLMVVGRRHRTGLTSRIGSVSAALAARSACPTAIIPETWSHPHPTEQQGTGPEDSRFHGQVVASVEPGAEALHLLEVAAQIAQQYGVPLCAVTVARKGAADHKDPWLQDLVHRINDQHPNLQCGAYTVSGNPAHEISEAARGARLLVMGTRGLSGIPGLVRGSVSQALLETATFPVLIVTSKHPVPAEN